MNGSNVYNFAVRTFDYIHYIFWIVAYISIYYEFCFCVFKDIRFFLCDSIIYFPSVILHFKTPCVVSSPNLNDDNVFQVFDYCLFLMIIVVSNMFRFSHCFQVILDSLLFLWIVQDCFCRMLRHMLSVLCCYVFEGVIVLLTLFFMIIQIPYLWVLRNILSAIGLRTTLLVV